MAGEQARKTVEFPERGRRTRASNVLLPRLSSIAWQRQVLAGQSERCADLVLRYCPEQEHSIISLFFSYTPSLKKPVSIHFCGLSVQRVYNRNRDLIGGGLFVRRSFSCSSRRSAVGSCPARSVTPGSGEVRGIGQNRQNQAGGSAPLPVGPSEHSFYAPGVNNGWRGPSWLS